MLTVKFLKALVTSWVGFVISCSVERLVKNSYAFRVIDNFSRLRKFGVG
jgi:UDP-glucose 4-epimerase